MLTAICQRCRRESSQWKVVQAEFNVGSVSNWKVKLCELCTSQVALVVLGALAEVRESDYSETEQNCGGCMGPCGRCHELSSACPLCGIDDGLVQEWVSKARSVAQAKGLLAVEAGAAGVSPDSNAADARKA
jgi:hypothetical protein